MFLTLEKRTLIIWLKFFKNSDRQLYQITWLIPHPKKFLINIFFQTCVTILALAAAALAAPSGPAPAPGYDYPDVAPLYTFGYNVNNKEGYEPQLFNHDENRDGYQTHGEYSVALPDGRIQRVVYRVDGDSGFIADVTYEGEARPYEYHPKPAPVYKPLPAPVVYKPAPAPVPAPVVYKPAPVVYKPAPVPAYTTRYLPAPVAVAYAPAPAPAPVVKAAPAPAPVEADRSGKSAGSNSKFNFGEVRFNPFG